MFSRYARTLALIASTIASTGAIADARSGGDIAIQYSSSLPIASVTYSRQYFSISFDPVLANSGTFEFSVLPTASLNEPWSFSAGFGMSKAIAQDIQLRFSYWSFQGEVTARTLRDGSVLAHKTVNTHGDESDVASVGMGLQAFIPSEPFEIVGYYSFTPGKFVIPSLDPNCASILCMVVMEDSFLAYGGVNGQSAMVPELPVGAQMVAGLLALALLWRSKVHST